MYSDGGLYFRPYFVHFALQTNGAIVDLEEIVIELKNKPGYMSLGRSVMDDEIVMLEQDLTITFPSQYKYFLKNYGYVEWFGLSIFGISDDKYYSTKNRTSALRNLKTPNGFNPAPTVGNVIEHFGGGGFYFLFAEESEKHGQVSLFTDEDFWNEGETWTSFAAFLESRI